MNGTFLNIPFSGKSIWIWKEAENLCVCYLYYILFFLSAKYIGFLLFHSFPHISWALWSTLGPSVAMELFYTCFVCCFLSLTLVTFCRPSSSAPITWHLLSPSYIFVDKLMNPVKSWIQLMLSCPHEYYFLCREKNFFSHSSHG